MNRILVSLILLAIVLVQLEPASGVTIDTVLVGNPGNPADTRIMNDGTTGYGSVSQAYRIGKHEVSNAQYIEFLNAADPTGANLLGLYHTEMTSYGVGGIIFASGAADGEKYSAKPGRDGNPVIFVSWYDAIRFANWLHNGQGNGDTEDGAYTLGALDASGIPIDSESITRNRGACWFLPNEDEWYKAAYHKNDGVTGNYWLYPTASDIIPYSAKPPGSDAPDPSNAANFVKYDGVANGYDDGFAVTGSTSFDDTQNYLTDVGAYTFSPSPYGTFDQGGNVWEWNETRFFGAFRGVRGGAWNGTSSILRASAIWDAFPTAGSDDKGFRVATIIPEPSAILLLVVGAAGMFAPPRSFRP